MATFKKEPPTFQGPSFWVPPSVSIAPDGWNKWTKKGPFPKGWNKKCTHSKNWSKKCCFFLNPRERVFFIEWIVEFCHLFSTAKFFIMWDLLSKLLFQILVLNDTKNPSTPKKPRNVRPCRGGSNPNPAGWPVMEVWLLKENCPRLSMLRKLYSFHMAKWVKKLV